MKEFFESKNTKDLMQDVCNLFGVKQSIVKQIWDYTLFSWFMKLSSQEGPVRKIEIPYIGTLSVSVKDEEEDANGNLITNTESSIELNPEFSKMLGQIDAEAETELSEFIEEQYIKPVTENVIDSY